MTNLVRAEFLKLRTTRAWIGYGAALVVISVIGAAGTVGGAADVDLGTPELSRDIIASSLFGGFIAFLVGIISVTAEWRHGTITRTFLASPRRERVLVAKGVTMLLLGVGLAMLAIAIVVAVAAPWLVVEGSSLDVDGGQLVKIVLGAALWGAFGVGVGAVIQSQTAAIVVAILWVLVAETLTQALLGLADLEAVADFLPGQALGAFEESGDGGLTTWAGGVVALGWVLGMGALGYVRMSRQDVT